MNLIKGGKPITPTGEPTENTDLLLLTNGGATVVDGATKLEVSDRRSMMVRVSKRKNGIKTKLLPCRLPS